MSKVKQEKFVFKKPPTFRDYFIGLSKRPCMQRSPIQNPDNLPGLRPEDDDLMPRIGETPDEDAPLEHMRGAGFKEACLVISLQNLGLPVVCDTDGPFTISFGNTLLRLFGVQLCHYDLPFVQDGKYIVHNVSKKHFFALSMREDFVQIIDDTAVAQVSLPYLRFMVDATNFSFYKCQVLRATLLFQKDVLSGVGILSKNVYSIYMKAWHCGHRFLSKARDIKVMVLILATLQRRCLSKLPH